LQQAATSFTVLSSAADRQRFKGNLSVAPKPVPFGDPIALNAAVSNVGNATSRRST